MIHPPLALYIHIPWCVQKCPYCDFNSHGQKSDLPEKEYISHLLDDLENDARFVRGRQVSSIFIGGGTPSLFSCQAIERLIRGVKQRIDLSKQAEITLEANPGTVESGKFTGFRQGGINRISIGVQSFQQQQLKALGRIHNADQAKAAVNFAHDAQLNSFNLDLMHGLPQQSLDDALHDLKQGIALAPPHLSWYQLTIEPNTLFHSMPPTLPDDDILWEIQEQGHLLLTKAGYQQYEISGYSKVGQQCQHNLNYWRFGDYLGIGCGAHGKITNTEEGTITRTEKIKHPKGYMDLTQRYLNKRWQVSPEELPFEYFMNRFRLTESCPKAEFEQFTGLTLKNSGVDRQLDTAIKKGLLEEYPEYWKVSPMGRRYLNSLLEIFV